MIFYELQIGRANKFIEGGSQNDWEGITCPKYPGHQRAGKRVTDLFLDVLSCCVVDFSRTMLSDVVITQHALQILRAAKLTGFNAKPTKIETVPAGVSISSLPKLWEFLVTGRGGLAHKDSGIEELLRCSDCGLVRYSAFKNGIVVNESTYDGSDFFAVAEYPRHILVSARAKSVLEMKEITNVSFIESSQIRWPTGVNKPR